MKIIIQNHKNETPVFKFKMKIEKLKSGYLKLKSKKLKIDNINRKYNKMYKTEISFDLKPLNFSFKLMFFFKITGLLCL